MIVQWFKILLIKFQHVFDYKQGERFGCVADIGWITGHSYVVYGPLFNGGTTVLFESTPVYPDPGRWKWNLVILSDIMYHKIIEIGIC